MTLFRCFYEFVIAVDGEEHEYLFDGAKDTLMDLSGRDEFLRDLAYNTKLQKLTKKSQLEDQNWLGGIPWSIGEDKENEFMDRYADVESFLDIQNAERKKAIKERIHELKEETAKLELELEKL